MILHLSSEASIIIPTRMEIDDYDTDTYRTLQRVEVTRCDDSHSGKVCQEKMKSMQEIGRVVPAKCETEVIPL